MTPENILDTFTSRMVDIELQYRATKQVTGNELKLIKKYSDDIQDKPDLKKISKSHNQMIFTDAITGEYQFYGRVVHDLDDIYKAALLRKNRQYQWLLVEAHEEFEDFLEYIYAYLGHNHDDLWPLSDYGNIKLPELSEKDFDWYLSKSRNKKSPKEILNRLRSYFPNIKNIESTNKLNINLDLALSLIENLRHNIVHTGGRISDTNSFSENTLSKSGLHNNGKPKDEYIEFINSFFGQVDGISIINLLEEPADHAFPFSIGAHINIFGKLTGYLLAYAYIIITEIQAKET